MAKKDKYVLWFNEIDKDDLSLVGGKGANLGEMTGIELPVPPGFVVTVKAYFNFLKANKLKKKIKKIIQKVENEERPEAFQRVAKKIKDLIIKGNIPKQISQDIMRAYLKLGKDVKHVLVAVRSSATAEDLPTASFAGQQATFLNVKGEANVVNKVRACWASLFEARAIFYRQQQGFNHFKVGIAVPVQKMIQSDVSGVMFTVDPITNEKNRILIEAIYGLGELIVKGEVIPDRYIVGRQKMRIIQKTIANQKIQLIKSGTSNKKTEIKSSVGKKQKLSDKKIIELAKLGKKIHQHYYFPQDIEWGKEGRKLYILQSRPVTTLKKKTKKEKRKINLPVLLEGESASPGIATGKVRIIKSAKEISKVKKGEILVTAMTTPDFVPAMKRVAGIVTDLGGQTSHAAIVSRELGLACVIGTKKATKALKNKTIITINGQDGKVYKGSLDWKTKTIKAPQEETLKEIELSRVKTATKLYVNLAEPDMAENIANKNIDGVGLLRAEFMIAEYGTHPRKLIADKKQDKFIDHLAEGLKTFCQAFDPRPVVYRATDFKTNEYRNLKGGKQFEPKEENPFLGFRGAGRYLANPDVFELELKAIKKVRKKWEHKNLWLMIPFARTPDEFREVKKIIVANGLIRSPSFKLWLMVEIPSNVILLEDFIKIGIDGVSIGTNDLTMLTLGADRDNAKLNEVFDERNPAVLWMIKKTLDICHEHEITSSICGQAPSFYPDLVKKLVKWGITSISVSPDAIDTNRELTYSLEQRLLEKEKKK